MEQGILSQSSFKKSIQILSVFQPAVHLTKSWGLQEGKKERQDTQQSLTPSILLTTKASNMYSSSYTRNTPREVNLKVHQLPPFSPSSRVSGWCAVLSLKPWCELFVVWEPIHLKAIITLNTFKSGAITGSWALKFQLRLPVPTNSKLGYLD